MRMLFDDLVGAANDCLRDRQAERLGGGEIDRQSKLCRELDRELARPRAVNYPVHIFGRAPDDVIQIRAELQRARLP